MANVKVRTEEELKRLEFNYYEAFNIKLDVTDGNTIAERIKYLCNDMANKSDPVKIRLGKELKDDALEVMQFDAIYDRSTDTYRRGAGGRKMEADACRRLHCEKVSAFIRTLGSRGVIYISEIKKVTDKNGIELKDVEDQLQALKGGGLKIIDDTKNIFNFTSYLETEKLLKSYQGGAYSDLFALIGVNYDISAAQAQQAELKSESDNEAKGREKSNDGVALKKLYGEARKIFDGSAASLAAYKKFVQFRDEVFTPLKALKDNGFTTIGRDEYLNYIGILCKKLGESDGEAAQDLSYILQFLRISLSGDAVIDKNIKVELCPYPDCGKAYIADSSAIVCPHCGRPLEKVCWNCKSKVRITSGIAVCPHCGATERAQAEFTRQTEALDLLLGGGKATAAQLRQPLDKIMAIVPGYENAPDSLAARKIAFYTQTVESRERNEQNLLSQFSDGIAEVEGQIALKNYFKAQSLLAALRKTIAGFKTAELDSYSQKISAEIAKSDGCLQQAKRNLADGSQSTAIANAAKALDICADNDGAKRVMRKLPPAAPAEVRCKTIGGKIIGVEWDCPPQQLVTYSVVRKAGSAPKNVNDGVTVASGLPDSFYEDKNITSGTPYYYGVYAIRAEVTSALTACKNSCAVFPDVYGCTQEMVEDVIKVRWTCPENVASITVRKVKGAASPTEGRQITTDGNGGFTDADCDVTGCSYLVTCNYNAAGAKISSQGVQLYYKPYVIPKTVQNIAVQRGANGQFNLNGGNITPDTRLYLFDCMPSVNADGVQSRDMLHSFVSSARRLNMVKEGDAYAFSLGSGDAGWLCAVNANDRLYVASKPVYVTTVSGLSGITYNVESGSLTIEFTKIPAVNSVIAKVSKTAFPSSVDGEGESYEFNSFAISGGQCIKFALPYDSMAYVTLFAYVGEGAQRALCAPVSLDSAIDNRKKQTVKYSIDYAVSEGKPFTVTVKLEADCAADLSRLVFVAGNPWPMNKNAGTEVYCCPSPQFKRAVFSRKTYTAKVAFKAPPMSKYNKISMFIDDDSVKTIILKQVNSL